MDNDPGFWHGRVALPQGGTQFGDNYQVVAAQFPMYGMEVVKVGSTSGWSWGTVSQTCVNVAQNGVDGIYRGLVLLCQYRAPYTNLGGDSGAPVLWYDNLGGYQWWMHNPMTLVGINWGHGADGFSTFSPWSAVENELTPGIGATWLLVTGG